MFWTLRPVFQIFPHCRREVIYEKNLLLNGLWELYQKNKRKR